MNRIIISFSFSFFSSIVKGQEIVNLPIKNGKIVNPRPYADHLDKRILIEPSNDFYVRACFKGRIINVRNDDDGYTIAVAKDSLIAFYSLVDSVLVESQQYVEKGSVIGMKIRNPNNEKFIILTVHLGKTEVDPRSYLDYQASEK